MCVGIWCEWYALTLSPERGVIEAADEWCLNDDAILLLLGTDDAMSLFMCGNPFQKDAFALTVFSKNFLVASLGA